MVEKRTDIKSILVIGSGPIIIGQGCEFDYSGTQACRALKEEGYKVSLINTNPATIMTDPNIADATYIEPIIPQVIEKIIVKENIDSILPTVGGQTALNCAMSLADQGILSKYGVKLIGANRESIRKAEDRNLFRQAMNKIGLKCPRSIVIHNYNQIKDALDYIGLPAVIRSSFTLGGLGSGIAYNKEEFYRMVNHSLEISPIAEIQVDESIIGWKEFEMEVMRDHKDNCIIICSIENIDPMGVHTGDSITVAPALTLRDDEYQKMRDASFAVLREMGVDTGGSNVQFAINPNEEDSLMVIEMNPRVSRSSALASKATGFPIAKVAAKLAVGYSLNEIYNDCNSSIPASFEPTLDYVVVKIPRFNFEKFPGASRELSTSMKSVGEVMAIGRSFSEALQKSLCSLETGVDGFNELLPENSDLNYIKSLLAVLSPDRIFIIADAFRHGMSVDQVNQITKYDKWFLIYIKEIIDCESFLKNNGLPKSKLEILNLKKMGFSDARLAKLTNNTVDFVERFRNKLGVKPVYKRVDTCAAEFTTSTSYMYSCYEGDGVNQPECEANVSCRDKVIIVGSGPNRIGQGIEFDYTCVHAAYVLKDMGYQSIMINCNPETVSTDYDTSDRLYFSPLTYENILDIIYKEQENGNLLGVIVQLGGQTPLKLAKVLEDRKIKILGTSFDSIDLAEDRERFQKLLIKLNLRQPANVICNSLDEVVEKAQEIGFPLVVRPSYVLGGQYMSIIYNDFDLENYIKNHDRIFDHNALLLDQFLTKAVEVDVDAVCDGENVYIAGIIEHIEEAGIHSGDSACSIPPYTLGKNIIDDIIDQTKKIALALKVVGLLNIQYAIKNQNIYILEVNPRASRTVPFVAKSTGVPLAMIATKAIMGEKIGSIETKKFSHVSVKEAVFSFSRFSNVDVLLGPEMKSTGEVMGIDVSFEMAFVKSQMAAGYQLPVSGSALISVEDDDKDLVIDIAKELHEIGFALYATIGTFNFLNSLGISVNCVNKLSEGRPHIIDMLQDKKIDLVINTSRKIKISSDSTNIRKTTLMLGIPYSTTVAGAKALVRAIKILKNQGLEVSSIQDYFK